MDVVERLSFEAVDAPTLAATEHVQRYRWAGELVRGMRVLDLCCGVGYGSLIMGEIAGSVHGVDVSEDAIRTARDHASDVDNVTFEAADAVDVVNRALRESHDAVVCFEGIEHVDRLDALIEGLVRFADSGGRVIVSVPNSRTFGEDNRFHLTDFDYDSAMQLWDRFEGGRRYLQFVAEGTMLVDVELADDELPTTAQLTLAEHGEPPYANNFLLAVNVPDDALASALASMRFIVAPYYNRALSSLERSNQELWQTNRRLGRQIDEIRAALTDGEPPLSALRLGRTSAASAVAKLMDERDAVVGERDRLRALLDSHGDPRLIPQLMEERDRLGAERGQAWHRYEQLRNRKIVRLALALARLFPTRR